MLSLIIRCFNEEKHIGRLLCGIQEQEFCGNKETIIVDSGSTDNTLLIASEFPVRIVKIAPSDFSFGRALNLGITHANGDIVVVASAHVYPVYRDWLEKLVRPFKNSQTALSYGKQRGNKITKFSEHRVFEQWFPDESNLDQNHPFCNNANSAIRRKVWEDFSYDEELTGLEDLKWAKEIMLRGYRVSYVADAEVVHVHKETSVQTFNRYMREAIALKQIYPDQDLTFHDFVKLYCSSVVADYIDAIRDGQISGNIRSIAAFRLMQYWGAYRGFNQRGPVSRHLKQRFYYPGRFSRHGRDVVKRSEKAIDYGAAAKDKGINVD